MITKKKAGPVHIFLMAAMISGLSIAAHAQTAADTARLAATSSQLETGGLKIGMSLKDLAPATRALNPLLKITNTETVTVWPMDRTDTSKSAPPGSPQSTQTIELQTTSERTPTTQESVVATLALYPNAPVVTRLSRVISYPDGAGPNYAQTLEALRAKYGQPTDTQVLLDSTSGKMSMLFWYFDKTGKLMPPRAPNSLQPCVEGMVMCKDRSMVQLMISASGNGIVKSMDYKLANGPLVIAAEEATDAYMQSVEDARTRQQTNDSKSRPLPKL
jgi:hypothetical protein